MIPSPPLNSAASSMNGSTGAPKPVIKETVPVPTWLPGAQALGPLASNSLSLALQAGIACPSKTVPVGASTTLLRSGEGLPLGSDGFL
jgi:hypothetical protein